MTEAPRPIYLCYDLKGIQSFIFAVPKLKYIVGGSALIDRFDRDFAWKLTEGSSRFSDVNCLFVGGGKGAFRCPDRTTLKKLKAELISKAHADGLSISFGQHTRYSEAALQTDQNFPYLPSASEMEGRPCEESGLYPTRQGAHPMIRQRVWQRGDHLARRYETDLLKPLQLPGPLASEKETICFFHEVSDETVNGRAGKKALGNRNRWAVIAMDGNDMGRQHQDGRKYQGLQYESWLKSMSGALDECSRHACTQGIHAVIQAWVADLTPEQGDRLVDFDDFRDENGQITLPIRPLLVGGDDVIVLCHVSYAMEFVKTVCQAFQDHSQVTAKTYSEVDLWPATGNELSISAGVLYAPISLPLATAIGYAESLLAYAKQRGRGQALGKAVPSCVDWESITEGVIDTPSARRQRDLVFKDVDCNEIVKLTTRPMTLEAYKEIEILKNRYEAVPGTIRHQILQNMGKGFWDRKVFLARLGKRGHSLTKDLEEGQKPNQKPSGKWIWHEADTAKGEKHACRSTPVPDALLLMEEENRMKYETTPEARA